MTPESDVFGAYRLLEKLGEGAMGTVWKALDLRLERLVALKLLKDVDESRHRALLAEAKLACRLNHPNIATIYEAGEAGGVPYIAMEFVEGQPLRAFLARRNEPEWLESVGIQAASALHHAHHQGIVHRDIKPDNLVLRPDGTLKVLDFGIAKAALHQGALSATAHHATLIDRTAPGYSQGTPAYMSPEQANGQPLGPASDQFSLGVTLHQLATGVHPFQRGSLVETLFAVVKDPAPPLASRRPDLSGTFAQAVDRMMAKDSTQRFASMADAMRAMEPGDPTVQVAPVQRQRSRTWQRAALASALLLAAGGAGLYLARRSGATPGPSPLLSTPGDDLAAGRRIVAILPLEQLGQDPAHAWLSNSLADAMAFALVRRKELVVVDRLRVLEVMHALREEPGKPLRAMGALSKALHAQQVLQGTYQISGERLRVSVRLTDCATGTAVQQFQVEGHRSRLLDLEDRLQQTLPEEMGLGRDAALVGPRARSPRTRELYTLGTQVLTEGNQDSVHLACSYFRDALALEPDYAPARAALAWGTMELGATMAINQARFSEAETLFRTAKLEAEKAIALDPSLPQAYRALSAILLRLKDYEGAAQAGLQAVRQDPTDVKAFGVLAEAHLGMDGYRNVEVARRYFEKALAMDPNAWHAHHRFAVLLQNSGDLERAVEHADRAIALRPSAELVYVTAADALFWLGRPQEAERRIRAGLKEVPGSSLLRVLLAYAAAEQGDTKALQALLKELSTAYPAGTSVRILLDGLPAAAAGDRAAAAATYGAYGRFLQSRNDAAMGHNERRTTSVNLYFMARTLARLGDRPLAQQLLDLADRLHPGKVLVAEKDPAFHP